MKNSIQIKLWLKLKKKLWPGIKKMFSLIKPKPKSLAQRKMKRLVTNFEVFNTPNRFKIIKKWFAGRTHFGRRSILSKGWRTKRASYTKNFGLQFCKYFLYCFMPIFDTTTRKCYITAATMSGIRTIIPLTDKLAACRLFIGANFKTIRSVYEVPNQTTVCEHLKNLTAPTLVSYLRSSRTKTIAYAKSAGVSAKIVKHTRLGLTVVKLPSGVSKTFNSMDIVMTGKILPLEKNREVVRTAGWRVKCGFKPTVRGVAKNPVDHPHGGRTKTVANPVSPWGWYTKTK